MTLISVIDGECPLITVNDAHKLLLMAVILPLAGG